MPIHQTDIPLVPKVKYSNVKNNNIELVMTGWSNQVPSHASIYWLLEVIVDTVGKKKALCRIIKLNMDVTQT